MKPLYIILLLVTISCSKKEQGAVVKHNLPESHRIAKDSLLPLSPQKVIVKDTLVDLTPDEITCIKKFTTQYKFSAFKVKMFMGKLANPNFEGDSYAADKEYVEFITKGCEEGINFGGKYTIIQMGCGCMCEHLVVVDRSNGEIFKGVGLELSNGDGRFGYTYRKDSKMIIADSGLFTDDAMTHYTCFYKTAPEIYILKSRRFKKLQ